MLTIRFFSLIREALDCEEMRLEWSEALPNVQAVKEKLVAGQDPAWQEALFHPNVVQAVNQRVVFPEDPVADGDEIAFFPPMTGG